MKKIYILCFLLIASSCASTLSSKGQNVKYITKQEAPDNCKQMPQTFESSFDLRMSDVIINMRNEVAEHGGNFLVIDTMNFISGGSGGYYSGTGRGYICD